VDREQFAQAQRRRREDQNRRNEEYHSMMRRRGEPSPGAPAGLCGRPSAEDVRYWTTRLPLKPPGMAR
jgi:hypothetical protein